MGHCCAAQGGPKRAIIHAPKKFDDRDAMQGPVCMRADECLELERIPSNVSASRYSKISELKVMSKSGDDAAHEELVQELFEEAK